MQKLKNIAKKMLLDEEGAALVEYGLLVGLIALICIAAITLTGQKISALFKAIADNLPALPGS